MPNNSFDEVPIRDTIKLLHEKLSKLFYLDSIESPEILRDIGLSISKCSDYCISSCAEIIIPPIIMTIHNCIRNECKTQLHPTDRISDLNHNNSICKKYSLQIEELLKILFNVLQKINKKTSKIVFSRISMAFSDIIHVIAKVLHIYIQEGNEFIIEHCIKISHFSFNIFWEYWEYKDINTDTNQYLIFPVTIQFLLTIAIPNNKEFKYSKEIRILSLKLLSEIPSIVKNNEPLIKVYPGVIQKLSMEIINSITKHSPNILEISLLTMIEWISNCLCNINPGTMNYHSNMENIKNTGKILNYIIKYKTFEFNLHGSSTNGHIYYSNDKAYMLKVRSFLVSIASMCLTDLFYIFHDSFDELLETSLDFLVSMKCEDDYINPLVDHVFNSILKNQSKIKMIFFSKYLQNFVVSFESINTEKLTSVEFYEENNLIEFVRILTKYIGFQKIESQSFQNIISTFHADKFLDFFFRTLITNRSLKMYEKTIKDFKKTSYGFKYESSSLCMENWIIKAIDIAEIVKICLIKSYFDDVTNNNENFDNIDYNEIFQLYGDVFTLTFFNIKRLGFEKSKLISGLIIKSISISILNLSYEKMDHKYIFGCLMTYFVKLNTKNKDDYNSMLDFILRISLCNASQLILDHSVLGKIQFLELQNLERKKLPNILINWFEFTVEELNKDFCLQNLSDGKEINRNILLILLGNLLLIARKIELDNKIFIRKFNKIVVKLISLYGNGSPTTKKITTYVLDQVVHMLGYSSQKFSINTVISEYSVEIIRSLEMMYYKGYSKEKVDLILTALEHCKLEFILELSDIIERFDDLHINNNLWIFEFVAITTKRLSRYILRYWSNFLFHKILKNSEISVFRRKLESSKGLNTAIKEACYGYFVDYMISQENNIVEFYSTHIFTENDIENHTLYHLNFLEDNLLEEKYIEVSNIQKIIERVIQIIYSYTSNIDGKSFTIPSYQHLSTYSLLNCIFILSTKPASLFPYANMIIPSLINQWSTTVNKIKDNSIGYFKIETIKLRELYQTNIIIMQLIISCGDFAIKIMEEKIIPLITEFIELILANYEIIILMDDKESKMNSEFQKLCISVLEILYYFTKSYLKLNMAEIKFETLNCIIKLLLSPSNSFFSMRWRIVISKIILNIFFKFPSIINSKLIIQKENNTTIHIKESIIMIKLVENNLATIFNSNINIISETQGELYLKQKINKF
ncbi:uncharacterized protein cubi_01070 [Cryptosporidium ubiquitum]|uniref:Uncharacterized protein n=1 Tax=Cryptosporidium ubiquitum TaxID=857276 RepID=A0A1J4MIZ0_9CRYT|nr:uncharacterized protein cubi_01070 [Cryptosporidium ubiquitum]OII74226.1 hypothetical protein cubi_01070 [Cryptosporidium ubiquitum]